MHARRIPTRLTSLVVVVLASCSHDKASSRSLPSIKPATVAAANAPLPPPAATHPTPSNPAASRPSAALTLQERRERLVQQRTAELAARRKAEMEGPDFVRPRSNNTGLDIKAGKIRVTLAGTMVGAVRVGIDRMNPADITPEQRQAVVMRNRVLGEDAVARQLGVTPEQRAALRNIPGHLTYAIDAATRLQFTNLFNDWVEATPEQRPAVEASLLTAARQFEATHGSSFRPSLEDRAAKIKATLTPAQIEAFKNIGR